MIDNIKVLEDDSYRRIDIEEGDSQDLSSDLQIHPLINSYKQREFDYSNHLNIYSLQIS